MVNFCIRCSIPSYQNGKLNCYKYTLGDVKVVMGIPCHDLDVPVHPRWVAKAQLYSIRYLESHLYSLPVGDEFTKIFPIFMCATILAPTSELEGMHDLWDFIWDIDLLVPRN